MKKAGRLFPAVWLGLSCPAFGSELFGGAYVHDVDTPFTQGGLEDGFDLQLGWRGARIEALKAIGAPSPHVYGSLATGGGTHFAAAGVSWRMGGRLFVRPGIGLAIHSRDSHGVREGIRTDLGSRILFAPELGIGYRMNERVSVEASWVHLSHGQIFGRQNPGMDSFGIRLSWQMD